MTGTRLEVISEVMTLPKSRDVNHSLRQAMKQLNNPSISVEDRKKGLERLRNRYQGSEPGNKQRIALEWHAAGGVNLPEDTKKESRALIMAIYKDFDTPQNVKQAIFENVLKQTEEHLNNPGTSAEKRPVDFLALMELHDAAIFEAKKTLNSLMLRVVNETHLTQEARAEAQAFLREKSVASETSPSRVDDRFEVLQQSLWLDMEQLKDPSISVEDRKNGLERLLDRFRDSLTGEKQRMALEWLNAGILNLPEDVKKESRALLNEIGDDPETPQKVKQAIWDSIGLDFSD
jgi:uncharacterized protein (UPF0147 family)